MAAPFGADVGPFSYDHDEQPPPEVGEALVSATGRAYLLTDVRPVRRGERAGRRVMVRAVVVRYADLPPTTRAHAIVWYPRSPKV
jgi:hypothetical protein